MRLAEWSGAELKILWPVGRYAQELAAPVEFFDEDFVRSNFELDEEAIELAYESSTHIGDFEELSTVKNHLAAGKDIVVENSRAALVLPGESQKEADLAYIETAALIFPSETVREALARFDEMVDGRKSIALHVRRGDIIEAGRWSRTYWPAKYVPDEYYDAAIEDDPEAAFVLFSDTPATLKRFQGIHGIRSATSILGLESMMESQRDFVELLAIARCDLVVSSSDSAFSSAASLHGGATKISLPEDMSEKMRIEAEQKLISRVESGPNEFLNIFDYGQCARRVVDIYKDGGKPGRATAIMSNAVENGYELPFLTRSLLNDAIVSGDDTACLKIMMSDQRVRKLRRQHFIVSDLLKHTIRRQMLAGFSYAGLGYNELAATNFSNLALSQTTICPLDILSVQLQHFLRSGHAGVPPTSLVPFFDGQVHPRGLASTSGFTPYFESRFLGDTPAYNWQSAFDLDWHSIGVNERPGPRHPQLKQIISVGKVSEDPLERSLAALALVRIGRKKRGLVVMADADKMVMPDDSISRALLAKRRAQLYEAVSHTDNATLQISAMLKLTDHPAFVAYAARYYMRRKNIELARDLVRDIANRPFYLAWIYYELFASRHQICENREELRQDILNHFIVRIPEISADIRVA